jgi:hypothetical protein
MEDEEVMLLSIELIEELSLSSSDESYQSVTSYWIYCLFINFVKKVTWQENFWSPAISLMVIMIKECDKDKHV